MGLSHPDHDTVNSEGIDQGFYSVLIYDVLCYKTCCKPASLHHNWGYVFKIGNGSAKDKLLYFT